MPTISISSRSDFRRWLRAHHLRERTVAVVLHKRHTGHPAPTHRELLEEAICFGWIDTTVKGLDDDRYVRNFTRRTEKGTWSDNTRRYARDLIRQRLMQPEGLRMYKLGLKRPTHDQGIPKNPSMPHILEESLAADAKANEAFRTLPPSTRRTLFRWLLMAKRDVTRQQRVSRIIAELRKGTRKFF